MLHTFAKDPVPRSFPSFESYDENERGKIRNLYHLASKHFWARWKLRKKYGMDSDSDNDSNAINGTCDR